MLLISQLKKGAWYRGFGAVHVAIWHGDYFISVKDGALLTLPHYLQGEDEHFEPLEEISLPPVHLSNNVQAEKEIEDMINKGMDMIDGL